MISYNNGQSWNIILGSHTPSRVSAYKKEYTECLTVRNAIDFFLFC